MTQTTHIDRLLARWTELTAPGRLPADIDDALDEYDAVGRFLTTMQMDPELVEDYADFLEMLRPCLKEGDVVAAMDLAHMEF